SEAVLDGLHGGSADREPEPAVLALQSEGLEWNHADARAVQQQSPDVLVGSDLAALARTTEEIETRREIERALGLDRFDREAALLHRGEGAMQSIESVAQTTVHLVAE